jgi:hypothetical protein
MQEGKFAALLSILQQSGTEFILVGGLAAVLQGAPVQTFDVDIVYSRQSENIERLLGVLQSIGAIFRIQQERRIQPDLTHLRGSGHLNLITRFGPLDLLANIGEGLSYDDLLPHSRGMFISETVKIAVLDLDQIIAIKERLGNEKDQAVLPILRATAREAKRRGS